jgi:hypothetical protein
MLTGVADRGRAVESLSHFGVLPALYFGMVTLPTIPKHNLREGAYTSRTTMSAAMQSSRIDAKLTRICKRLVTHAS